MRNMKLYVIIFLTSIFFACNSENKKSIEDDTIKKDSISRDSLNCIQDHAMPMPCHFLQQPDSLFHIEYCGEKTDHYAIIPEAICKKWGFEIWPTWGCQITKEKQEKIIKRNMFFNEQMKKKHGKDWKERFEKETGKDINLFLRLEL